MKINNKAFTVIELIVVIAIISLVVSVALPSLSKSRQIASALTCQENVKSLNLGYFLYAADNNGYISTSYVARSDEDNCNAQDQWVLSPRKKDKNFYDNEGHRDIPRKLPEPTLIDRQTGIKAGALWNYVNDINCYYCPDDTRNYIPENDESQSQYEPELIRYRSYSIPDCLTGKHSGEEYLENPIVKFSQIKQPKTRYVFIECEEQDKTNHNYNHGGWTLNPWDGGRWLDKPANFHEEGTVFGFADGHVKLHTWQHPETIEPKGKGIKGTLYKPQKYNNEDLLWLIQGWAERRENKYIGQI